MTLHGANLIGTTHSAAGNETFQASNPQNDELLPGKFVVAMPPEVNSAVVAADAAFDALRGKSADERAKFLEAIADEIMNLGDALLERAEAETGLPRGRLEIERGRTVNQAKLLATVIREANWTQPRIDHGDPERKPQPKPDVRQMLMPIGPVAVFGASNFPLAISVAGSDTIGALGVGCPVIAKAHESHPGISEMIAGAILTAAANTGMPEGVFSMLHGGREVGEELVKHPLLKAVAFTGSLRAGRAIFDTAAARPEPIPVFAEMGSINPVFVLPGALEERGEAIAQGYVQSLTLGVGQFCTQPGLLLGKQSDKFANFVEAAARLVDEAPQGTMLNVGICQTYNEGVERIAGRPGVETLSQSSGGAAGSVSGRPALLATDAEHFLKDPALAEEVFGPSSIVIRCSSDDEMLKIARGLEGHLTATIHGTPEELAKHTALIRVLEKKVGRIVFNGFPTGVEVCAAMHHGGPYPATTDPRVTSIGTASIFRFLRPVCYQGFSDEMLPDPLKDANPQGIWRLVDGKVGSRE